MGPGSVERGEERERERRQKPGSNSKNIAASYFIRFCVLPCTAECGPRVDVVFICAFFCKMVVTISYEKISSYVVPLSALYVLYKMNDDSLSANFRKCLPITYDSYGGSLPCGESGRSNTCYTGIILYVLLLNVTFLDPFGCRSLWIRKGVWLAQERRHSNIFCFGTGFSDGGFGNLALNHFLMDWRKSR